MSRFEQKLFTDPALKFYL